jgi:mono/diheme cytochrome c family protein
MSKAITVLVVLILVVAYWLFSMPRIPDTAIPQASANVERGRYLVDAGGCVTCHLGTEHPDSLSGGLALESPFGTFHASNITPDPTTGIGGWTGVDFLAALKHGRSPDGGFYYPAFPYPYYAGMTDEDVLDIAAYLMTLPPVTFEPPEPEVPPWLKRWMLTGWNLLADITQPAPAAESDPIASRGAYLARNLGHCGECHTPRNALGIVDRSREFGGGRLGDKKVEPIDQESLADWTAQDLQFLMVLGVKPDGEFVGGKMEPVVEHNTSKLTDQDRQALAAFLKRPAG